jgi:septal ring factor EnvC (AmiA/AmiB activator)
LQENSLDDIEKLSEQAQQAKDDFNGIRIRIQDIDIRLKEISMLQKHIGIYGKTREIFSAYRKTGFSKKYLSKHSESIAVHKSAKKYFDSLGLEKLPTINKLKTEYATLSTEKKKLYANYHSARKFMQDVLSAQQNVHQLLNYRDTEKKTEFERG